MKVNYSFSFFLEKKFFLITLLLTLFVFVNTKAEVGSINPSKTGNFTITNLETPSTFTIEAWVILARASNAGYTLFTWKNATIVGGCEIKISTTGQLQFTGYNSGTSTPLTVTGNGQSPCTYGVVHIAVSAIPGNVKLYVNGNMVASETMHASIATTNATGCIFTATGTSGNTQVFQGLDELRFWNTERTIDQIREGMAAPLSTGLTDASDLNLLAYYNFDRNNTGTTISECSTNGTIDCALPATSTLAIAGAYQEGVNFASPNIANNPSTSTLPIVALRDSIGNAIGAASAELPPYLSCSNITQSGTLYCTVVSGNSTATYTANDLKNGIAGAVGNYKFDAKGLRLNRRLKFPLRNAGEANLLLQGNDYKAHVVLINEQGQASPVYTTDVMNYRKLLTVAPGDENIIFESCTVSTSTITYNGSSYTFNTNGDLGTGSQLFGGITVNTFPFSLYGLPLTGDFDVKARFTTSGTNANRITGILAVENNSQFSPMVATGWSTQGTGYTKSGMWVRPTLGTTTSVYYISNTALTGGNNGVNITNKWFRLVRQGDYFASYSSNDDITYSLYGEPRYAPVNKKLYVGIFNCANNMAPTNPVLFSDLTFVNNSNAVSIAPSITTQPSFSGIINEGGSSSLSVVATCAVSATFTYQWKVSTDNGLNYTNVVNGTNYANATSSTLSLIATPLAFSGNVYRCDVSVGGGIISSSSATLTVKGIVVTKTGQLCANGGSVTLSVPDGADSYSWSDGSSIISTTSSLTITTSGSYTVAIVTGGITSTSTIQKITSVIPIVTISGSTNVFVGNDISLTANGSNGSAPYTYTWTDANNATSTNTILTITSATLANSGNYSVVALDSYGCSASATVSVSVNNEASTVTVTALGGAGGFVNNESSTTIIVSIGASSTASITASPTAGYEFINWTNNVDNSIYSTLPTLTFVGTSATLNLTANFRTASFIVNFVSGANGSISGSITQLIYYGATCTSVLATPETGYEFLNWTGITSSNANPLIYVATASGTITANFKIKSFIISVTTDKNGKVEGVLNQSIVYGSEISPIVAKPNNGYYFVNWTMVGTGLVYSSAATLTITNIMENYSLKANFAPKTYTINAVAGEGGKISGNTSQTVNFNENATELVAIANEGYKFTNWTVTGTTYEYNSSATLTITAVSNNIYITANFSNLTKVLNLSSENLNVYPTYVSDNLNIVYNGTIQSVEVFAMSSIMTTKQTVNNSTITLNTSSWKAGTYFVKIITNSGIYTRKIFVIK